MFKDCRTLGVPMSDDVRNTIIIGSGPAGYTAGLYTARAMLEPLMFAGYASGGCLLYTSPSPRDRTRSRMPSSA